MRLHFLLGRAGTGKTHACLEAIRAGLNDPYGPPLVFIVPEQATFQMERALLTEAPVKATQRAHVLSFQRLTVRVLQEAGQPALPPLGPLGKRMLLRALIRRDPSLRLFERATRHSGFVDQLADTLTELRQHRLKPDDLARASSRLPGDNDLLAAKLRDLASVYRRYEESLAGRFTDPDEAMDWAARLIPRCRLLHGARVWIDGFAGFTPQEYALLRTIWREAEETTIALCLDGREAARRPEDFPDELDVFAPTQETLARLYRYAREDGVPVAPLRVLDGPVPARFARSPALAYLEAHLFEPEHPAKADRRAQAAGRARAGETPLTPAVAAGEQIALVIASDPLTEVAAAGREMLRLCRERGYRFREMSVILRDLDGYEDLIRQVFTEMGIPHFIDRKRTLAHHPLIELVRSAFEVYLSQWSPEAVFRCLGTGFFPVSQADIDRLENYVLAHGLRGRAWFDPEPWTYYRRYTVSAERAELGQDERRDLDEIHRIREQAAAPLRRFCLRLQQDGTARAMAATVWALLDELGVAQKLAEWSAAAEAEGRLAESREHAGAWDGVMQLLDDMVQCMDDQPLTPREGLQLLEAGLESLRVGLIPPAIDQVLVGSAERSRQPDIRAAFVLGASNGAFPPPPPEDVVFNDDERDRIRDVIPLAPTSRTRLFHEQYLTYICLTRASEYLWVSYPAADSRGKAQSPSPVFVRLREMFPSLPVRDERASPDDPRDHISRATSARQLVAAVAQWLRRHREGTPVPGVVWSLYDWICTDAELRDAARRVLPALHHRNDPGSLPADLAQALYGGGVSAGAALHTSVTRLETFAACPFQHFAAHGLRLRERALFELDRLQVGSFLHAALRDFVLSLREGGVSWASLEDEAVIRRIDECVDRLVPALGSEILLSSAKHRFLASLLRQQLRRAALMLTAHARRSRFETIAVEVPFGRGGGLLPALRVATPAGRTVTVTGQIDRIDVACAGNNGAEDGHGRSPGCWVRIIDYKSTARGLHPGDVIHGLALQLPTYLAAVLEHDRFIGRGPLQPAGVLYFPLRDILQRQGEPRASADGEPPLRTPDRRWRMNGLVVAEADVLRMMDCDLDQGSSNLIPAELNKDGSVSARSQAASRERLLALAQFARYKIGQLADEVLSGRVAVAPYRMGGRRPCPVCPYRSVCQFDPLIAGNGYRPLERPKAPVAWAIIEETVAVLGAAAAAGERTDKPEGGASVRETDGGVET